MFRLRQSVLMALLACFMINPNVNAEAKKTRCYEIGYKFGYCATRSLMGYKCKKENDVNVPSTCRNKNDTEHGINDGTRDAYLNTDGVKIPEKEEPRVKKAKPSVLQSSTLDDLRKRFKGLSKDEVNQIVGRPDRIEFFSGYECWIYGNTFTNNDVGFVFDNNHVMTITTY